MGVFRRRDSPYWWLWLETAPPGQQRERTEFLIGTDTKTSRPLAEQVYYQRMQELAARIHRLPSSEPQIRFEKYADDYEANVIAHHRGAERERELLVPLRNYFRRNLLQTIDRARVQQYLTHRVKTGSKLVSARTANREVDLLKAMLRDAVPTYLEASPILNMPRLKTTKPKRRRMSLQEERQLLKVATPLERALIVLGVDTMMRLGDLLDLRRSDREGRWLYVKDPKGGEPYETPLTARAAAALDKIRHEHEYYFHEYRQAQTERDRRKRVREVFEELCKRAKVPYGRKVGGLTFHWATRRTGATRLLVEQKVPLTTVMALGDWHTPETLLQIYAEADRRAMQAAVRLPRHSRKGRRSA